MEFSGQVALVTGASRGIGAAIALELARKGLRVVGTATSETGAQGISRALEAYTGCYGRVLNVTDGAACDALVDSVIKEQGSVQVLVNNAGITRDNLAMRMKDEDWDAVLDANLKGVFRMSRAVMRPMMKQRYGRIVNITSVVGVTGNPGQANYVASKAGVIGLTKSLAQELAARNVTVNAVAPGFIATPMTDVLNDKQKEMILGRVPAGKLGMPEDVAAAVLYLVSDEAGYVTGQTLHVNGGMAMI